MGIFWLPDASAIARPRPCPPRPRHNPPSAAGTRVLLPRRRGPQSKPPETRAAPCGSGQGPAPWGSRLSPGALHPPFLSRPQSLGPPGAGSELGKMPPPREARAGSPGSEEGVSCWEEERKEEGWAGSAWGTRSGRGGGGVGTDARSGCSGTPGSGLLEPPTAPFVLPAFHPLQLRPSWPNPAAAPARGSAPRPSGFQQQQLGGPAAPTPLPLHRALPRTAAAPGEGAGGLGDPGDQRLARVARVLPSRPPRACHLGLSSSPPRRPTGSKPQAGRGSRFSGRPLLGLLTPARVSLGVPRPSPLSLPAWRQRIAPSWRSLRPQLAARHSPGGRGAAPAPRARAGRLPRGACPGALAPRAGALCPSPAGA